MNINLLRAGDEVIFADNSKYIIKEAWSAGDIYQFVITENGKDITLSYEIDGTSLDYADLNIVSYKLNERPEDKVPMYIPHIEYQLLPVLTINGEDKVIVRLVDLDGIEIKEPQVLKANYKHSIVVSLLKKFERQVTCLKEEKIICQSKEECEEKLKEIEAMFSSKEEKDLDSVKKLFENILTEGDKNVH